MVRDTDTVMMSVTAKNNQDNGITVRDAYNTSIDCMSVVHNKEGGMIIKSSNVTHIAHFHLSVAENNSYL